jgi:TonB family protein
MPPPVVSTALAVVLVLAPVAAGYAPARSQEGDFSITNQEPVAATPFRRNLMKQLQQWWEVHAYYPKHASNNDEAGTVKIHLKITPDGAIFMVTLVESSGSRALDAAGLSAFRSGALQRFPEGEPTAELDLPVHYVLAHRHDEQQSVSYTPTPYRAAFTIGNEPVKSQILETMLQRTCTGTVTRNGGINQPWRGIRINTQATFFRKPDGTLWVDFHEQDINASVSPVVELGQMLQWVGPQEYTPKGLAFWTTWTVWADGPRHLSGAEGSPVPNHLGAAPTYGMGGPVDLTCSTVVLPVVAYSNMATQAMVTPPGDPP